MYQDVDVPSPDANHPDGGYIDWSFLLVNTDHPDDPDFEV